MAWRLGLACSWTLSCAFAAGVSAQVPLHVDAPAAPRAAGLMPGVDPLPEHPTPEQVRVYVMQIAEVTDALPNNPQRDDPQAALLEALADDHLDQLVQAHESYPQLRYYLEPIIHREIARRGGPDAERLAAVTLGEDADEDAAWSYVLDLAHATIGQRRVSANDPQVAMLEALADGHMGVLIDAIRLPELRFYALLAVRRTADESHKETVIGALCDQPRLIGVLRQHGWAEEARDQLILGLERGVDYMPRTWVQVMVELEDTATYDALALHLVRARCSRTYYYLMCDLPGIRLDTAVRSGWEAVHTAPTHPRELREVSEIAVAHGHLPALDHLVSLLPSDDETLTGRNAALRTLVLTHIAFSGSNSEVRDWLDTNRDLLVFDPAGRVFYVGGQLQ